MRGEDKRRSAADCSTDFYRYQPEWNDDAGDDPLSSSCLSLGGEPARPQYLWEHIPPRLTTAAPDADLLQLPDGGDDEDEDLPPAPSAESHWWAPAERGVSSGFSSAVSSGVSTVSVSINGAEQDQRRPLHTSGGRLAPAGPQIAIGLPSSEPNRGHIQLQISGCPASLTVSVQTMPPAAPVATRPRRPRPAATPRPEPAAEPSDEKALSRALGLLRESGWYYGALSWQQAQLALESAAEGTFLARDSLHRRFVFALSMQTSRGPTSMRVQLCRGRFRLDAPAELLEGMPTFADVNALVEHYAAKGLVAVDGMPQVCVRLGKPLRKEVPSLQHWCRLALNASGSRQKQAAVLPAPLRTYLDQYPYSR